MTFSLHDRRKLSTMTPDLEELATWLPAGRCSSVAMESTGVHWQPIYSILEGRFELFVVNARSIKRVSGRKTDMTDEECRSASGDATLPIGCKRCWKVRMAHPAGQGHLGTVGVSDASPASLMPPTGQGDFTLAVRRSLKIKPQTTLVNVV